MDQVAFYRQLYAYNHQVLENYLARIRRMPWKEAIRDRGIGLGSFRDTFIHILRVHDGWLNFVVPGRMSDPRTVRSDPASYRSGKDLQRLLQDVWDPIDVRLGALTGKGLQKVVKAPWMPGRYTVADVLMQCTFEEAHHIGELIGASWRMDEAPPQMMWIPIVHHQKVSVR